jgi:DNA (cytosine-5)-methyltransferase 1
MPDMKRFTFVDLFAGIGGFHGALSAMGGECVYAVEIDPAAAKVYERNWGMNPLGDITEDANDDGVSVPEHDVLCAGFPCQPFSKSGAQRGMDETRGTLFWNILRVIQECQPSLVLLENVRNLAGPRHSHEWQVIVETLRAEGYRVSDTPAVFSPHLLPPSRGGRPQVRERVFIAGTRIPGGLGHSLEAEPPVTNRVVDGWDPREWDLESDLPLDDSHVVKGCELSTSERLWINAWDEFVQLMWESREGRRLPGFPLWADEWRPIQKLSNRRLGGEPRWKANYLVKNAEFYTAHRAVIDDWAARWGLYSSAFPPSRRKFEWQAQDTARLWDAVLHMRPSGIRAKAPTYLPALVAITQTSIIGPRERRLSPREAARLQGLPDWFDFGDQPPAATYRQLGNGVSVGAVWHVARSVVERDEEVLKETCPTLVASALGAEENPDTVLGTKISD